MVPKVYSKVKGQKLMTDMVKPDLSVPEILNHEYESRILVVDDDHIILNLIARYFSAEKCSITKTTSGYEALKMIEEGEQFDLVILDIMMPEISGYEVCRRIRMKHSLVELPIIILTARSLISDIIEAFEAGANDYISKPFDRNELLARTQTLIKLKRLSQANSILQEAISVKNKFIQMTIHDLRNPLTIIIGLANLMKIDIAKEHEHHEFVSLILESSELMLNMVNELLSSTKEQNPKLCINKEVLDLNKIVKAVVEKNRRHAIQKRQEIFFSPGPEGKCNILTDSIKMQEILDNLISNAVKYSPKNKDISVSVELVDIDINKKNIRFSVKDNGPGFTDDDKKKIFGKFQRLSAVPTAGEPSSGLGLSIVKQLVEILEGNIWLESEEGKGSTFVVEFPVNSLN